MPIVEFYYFVFTGKHPIFSVIGIIEEIEKFFVEFPCAGLVVVVIVFERVFLVDGHRQLVADFKPEIQFFQFFALYIKAYPLFGC